ncbi:NADH:flavin oxidoreductase [Syntrophorhabdus aromaticivorans]|uniref:oxidoreductase n=1 Tax=Syntrophorhabdus aromaticivorans TaxID=328301 RepID=UPI00041AD964|nr:NADH:flavin oxidoreductase [Syntrophorhabdus aromaticivorans]
MERESILFTPFGIGGLTLSNRIIMAPTYLGYGHNDGTVSDLLLEHYKTMAASGAALIVVENTGIHPSGLGAPSMLRIDDDRYLKGLAGPAKVIRAEGALAFIQINHAGRYAFMPERMAPSPVPIGKATPREMTLEDIEHATAWFARAAARAQSAGFDGVELHGGTGYLLSQFLSPRTNRRTDGYGGTPQNRMRFPLEVVDAVMAAVGKGFPVGYRFIAEEFFPEGLHTDEAIPFAKELAKKGIAYLSVMVGTHESFALEPYATMEKDEGYMAGHAATIKKAVPTTPVITAGRIQSPATARAILEAGKADLIGLARVLFADPLWPKKARGLVSAPIVPCSPSCSLCTRRVMTGKPPFCSQWDKERRQAFLGRIGETGSPEL